jgi:hypothetical protein
MFYTANRLNKTVLCGWELDDYSCAWEVPQFYGTPSVHKVCSWNVSYASLINSTPSYSRFCKTRFDILPSTLKSSLFASSFPTNTLNVFLITRVHGTCPPQIILFDVIMQSLWWCYVEERKMWRYMVCVEARVALSVVAMLRARRFGIRFMAGCKRFLSSPKRPDRFWGPNILLFSEYGSSFPGRKATGAWSWPPTSD